MKLIDIENQSGMVYMRYDLSKEDCEKLEIEYDPTSWLCVRIYGTRIADITYYDQALDCEYKFADMQIFAQLF